MFGTDFSASNVALASIAADLHIGHGLLPWVITTFSLTYAGFLILGGRIADLYGRRHSCVAGLCIFTAGELIAAAALNPAMLIAGRALTGLASAILIPASFSLINILLPEGPPRNRGYAVFGITQGVAVILGLCGGGAITTTFGWRAVFLVTIPLAIWALTLALKVIPTVEREHPSPSLDIGGAVLITLGIGVALLSLTVMSDYGWLSIQGWGVLVLAAAIITLFFIVESRVRNPLVPPTIFRFPNLLGANLASLCALSATGGLFVLLNLFMQRDMHFSAMQSGLGMLPYAFAVIFAGQLMGHGMNRHPLRLTIVVASIAFIMAMLLLAAISPDRGYFINLVPGMVLAGIGGTLSCIPLMAVSTGFVPPQTQGVATGVLITFQQIGLALGVSTALAVMGAETKVGAAPTSAFGHAFLTMAAFVVVALLCVLLATRTPKTAT